jgi:hypothetical protein
MGTGHMGTGSRVCEWGGEYGDRGKDGGQDGEEEDGDEGMWG